MLTGAMAALISGLISLGMGQSAYLTALVTLNQPTTAAGQTAAARLKSCDIVLSFFDGQSDLLKSKEVWINPGSSAALRLDLDDLKGGDRERGPAMVYATLALNSDPTDCPLIGTLDITDPTGKTAALLPLRQLAPGLTTFGAAQ